MAELTAWYYTAGQSRATTRSGRPTCGDVERGPMPEDGSGYARKPAVIEERGGHPSSLPGINGDSHEELGRG
ncbi:hypothetical protein [Rhodococcus sp. WB9]|uniref:hypothetical protein n=1 Tax=Rhodococcus sp. WB9 TaxID=2594007 RepID=UPI0021B24F6F|nr:hypothetical protein [Rhodococcus sp. WB9]